MSDRKEEGSAHIKINKTVINRMKGEKIIMDQLGTVMFILKCLFEGKIGLLDCADDSNKELRMNVMYKQLCRRELIEPDGTDKNYKLTPRGYELATFIAEQEGKREEVEVVSVKVKVETPVSTIAKEVEDECAGWIGEYVDIFPTVSKGDRPLRVHPETCINKMNAFLKKYKYSKEVVLAATKLYIEDQVDQGSHEYTSRADNFISKYAASHPEYSSPLAAWCKRYLDEKDSPGRSARLDTSFMDIM